MIFLFPRGGDVIVPMILRLPESHLQCPHSSEESDQVVPDVAGTTSWTQRFTRMSDHSQGFWLYNVSFLLEGYSFFKNIAPPKWNNNKIYDGVFKYYCNISNIWKKHDFCFCPQSLQRKKIEPNKNLTKPGGICASTQDARVELG